MKLIIEPTPADKIAYKVPDKQIQIDESKTYIIHVGKVYDASRKVSCTGTIENNILTHWLSVVIIEKLPEVKP